MNDIHEHCTYQTNFLKTGKCKSEKRVESRKNEEETGGKIIYIRINNLLKQLMMMMIITMVMVRKKNASWDKIQKSHIGKIVFLFDNRKTLAVFLHVMTT